MNSDWDSGPDNAAPDDSNGWHRFAELASLPMAAVEGLGHIVRYANPAFCRLVGASADSLIGRPFSETVPVGDGCLLILDRVRQTGEPESYTQRETALPAVYWSLAMWSILTPREEPVGVMIQVTESARFHDSSVAISEALMLSSVRQHELVEAAAELNALLTAEVIQRRSTEELLRESEALLEALVKSRTGDLERSVREMDGFTYAVAHELRAPIRAIVSASNILIKEAGLGLADDQVETLNRQALNALKLAKLIDDLLHLARLARQPMTRSWVDLTAAAKDWAARLPTAYPGVDFQTVIEEGLFVEGDPTTLKILLQNLLDNAAKFSPQGSTIGVGSLDEAGQRAFFVRDQGIGFEMAYHEKIYKPFERLVSEKDFPGTGMGLANACGIVQRHGGTLWAEAKPGEGATFFFTLA